MEEGTAIWSTSDMNWLTRFDTSPDSSVIGTRSALRYIFRRRSIIIRFDALRMRYCDMQRNTLPMMFTPTSTPSRTSRSLMRSAGVGWSAAGK